MNTTSNGIPVNVQVSIDPKSASIVGAILAGAIIIGVVVALIARKKA